MKLHARQSYHSSMATWRLVMWAAAGSILLLPLVAMQFTPEVAWTLTDLAAAAALLVGAAAAYEIAIRRARGSRHRVLIGGGLAAAVLLAWAEGAVGIF